MMLRNATDSNFEESGVNFSLLHPELTHCAPLFGVKLPLLVLLTPVGVQGILHKDGELATARAEAHVRLKQCLRSTETGTDGISYTGHVATTRDFRSLCHAEAAGFTTLCITLDTFSTGWRLHNLETAYLPFIAGVGAQVGTSDPAFMQHMGVPMGPDERPLFPLDLKAFRKCLAASYEGEGPWGSALLRDNLNGPVVLKGVQTMEDAQMDGTVVSCLSHATCNIPQFALGDSKSRFYVDIN
ncbi:hypothetical protein V8E53_002275 [Lactarius tabidus]